MMNARRRISRISDALHLDAVTVRCTWPSFDAAVAGIVGHLVTGGLLPPELGEVAVERICEREAVASTAMVDIGISIPHARLEGITGVVAAVAVSPKAVYHVGDGLPISIVVLVLSSPALAGEHLNVLSSVSLILQSARTRESVRNAASGAEVLQLLRANERG